MISSPRNLPLFTLIALIALSASSFSDDLPPSQDFSLHYVDGTGLVLQNADVSYKTVLNLLIQTDLMQFYSSPELKNGTNMQTAQAYLSGNIKLLNYMVSYDFIQNQLEEANVSFNGSWGSILLGQNDPSYGLANSVSDSAVTFMSPPLLVNAFSPPYTQGLYLNANTEHFSTQWSLFGPGSSTPSSQTIPLGSTLRLIYDPRHNKGDVLHFGLSLWQQTTGEGQSMEFSSIPEMPLHNSTALVDTGTISAVGNYQVDDLEWVWVRGSKALQAEYTQTWVHRLNTDPTLTFHAYYLLASYFLTGESLDYNYPGAYFTGITPIQHKKWGAWQVLMQYSDLDLNSHQVYGGAEHNLTLGLNWYPNTIVQVMFNYIHGSINSELTSNHNSMNAYGLQLQLAF